MEKLTTFLLLMLSAVMSMIVLTTFMKTDLHVYVTYLMQGNAEKSSDDTNDSLLSLTIPTENFLKKMNLTELSEMYHRYMNNLQVLCPVKQIFGGVGSGYGLCSPVKQPGQTGCSAILIRQIKRNQNTTKPKTSTVLSEIKKDYSCKVFQYEVSAVLDELQNENIQRNFSIKEQFMKQNIVDVLVIDTTFEASSILRRLLGAKMLKKVKQLVVNFNTTTDETTVLEYVEHLLLLRNLYIEGFRIFSYERIPKCVYKTYKWRTGCYVLYMMKIVSVYPPMTFPIAENLKNLATSAAAKFYHQYMVSTQMLCKDIVRVGHIGAGGWDVCNDTEYRPPAGCLVYSFGIARDWSFDDEMARRYGCNVHSFDPTIYQPNSKRSDKVEFHNMGLGENNGPAPLQFYGTKFPIFTLDTIKRKLDHEKRHIDVLKMDIEFSEWKALPNMIKTGVLFNVTQLLLEFHYNVMHSDMRLPKKLEILRDVYNLGFRLFSSHPNSYPVNLEVNRITRRVVTKAYELHFVNLNMARTN